MALAPGTFTPGGAGITSPGGAYNYAAGATNPQFYGGEFFIDTGIDDPVGWDTGLDAAELYEARVYGAASTVSGTYAADTYLGRWQITATPVWSSKFYALPTANQPVQQRIFIIVRAWLTEPVSAADGAWQRLNQVKWTLYRA